MDLQLRKEFLESLEKLSDKYGLQDIIYATFTLKYGYRNKYCASDIVFALLAILESSVSNKSYYNYKNNTKYYFVSLEIRNLKNSSTLPWTVFQEVKKKY